MCVSNKGDRKGPHPYNERSPSPHRRHCKGGGGGGMWGGTLAVALGYTQMYKSLTHTRGESGEFVSYPFNGIFKNNQCSYHEVHD